MDIQQPIAHVKDADIVGMSQGEKITRVSSGIEYVVQTFSPDGTGMTDLGLSKA